MDSVLRLRTIVEFVVVMFLMLTLQGCLQGQKRTALGSGIIQQAKKSGWILAYADENRVRVYENGQVRTLAQNPAGYDSLDYWIGYSSQLGAIVFHRSMEDHFRLLDVDISANSVKSRSLGRACAEECEAHDYFLHNGKLWVVRGVEHSAELWSYDTSGKWERVASWNIPKMVPVSLKWSRAPVIDGSTVAFMSPSDYMLLSDTAGGPIRVLSEGDSNYRDPGFDDTGSGEIRPVMSPGGEWVFFRVPRREDPD